MGAMLMMVLRALLFPSLVQALPIRHIFDPRELGKIQAVDPSADEWASIISSVGPLILLVGENTTKEFLRHISGLSGAFSLASAPLGLITVVKALIRLCGIQRLRAFLGHGLEARNVIALEVTQINCGGVNAHLTDGYVVRGTSGKNSNGGLLAVKFLEQTQWSSALQAQIIDRISAFERFEEEKRRVGIPPGEANWNWCLHIRQADASVEVHELYIQVLAQAVGIDFSSRIPDEFSFKRTKNGDIEIFRGDSKSKMEIIEDSASGEDTLTSDITFITTFDAVSEFTSNRLHLGGPSCMVGLISFSAILVVYVMELRQKNWEVTLGLLLALLGYLGIVIGVVLAALLIQSSCLRVQVDQSAPELPLIEWNNGMVETGMHVDSMETTGSALHSASASFDVLEAVYIKRLSAGYKYTATLTTAFLVAAFIVHYLGLRMSPWWVSVSELIICVVTAFIRSLFTGEQARFSETPDVKIEQRCSSTGVIHTQTAHLVDDSTVSSYTIDARSYAPRILGNAPTFGERVAYQTAKLAFHDPLIRDLILALTGMQVAILPLPSDPASMMRSVILSFTGGVLVTEGLAAPACVMLLSFQASLVDLAAPSGLLSRGILRQPEWHLQKDTLTDIPLGRVYIFAMQNLMDWWTMSEDRNDLGDLQRNLHWPMFLINVAFFMKCIGIGQTDMALLSQLELVHSEGSAEDRGVAQGVVDYLRTFSQACTFLMMHRQLHLGFMDKNYHYSTLLLSFLGLFKLV